MDTHSVSHCHETWLPGTQDHFFVFQPPCQCGNISRKPSEKAWPVIMKTKNGNVSVNHRLLKENITGKQPGGPTQPLSLPHALTSPSALQRSRCDKQHQSSCSRRFQTPSQSSSPTHWRLCPAFLSASKVSTAPLCFQSTLLRTVFAKEEQWTGNSCTKSPGLGPPGFTPGHLGLLFRLISPVLREAAH